MADRILLTAAGFSANFGAPLASNFSDELFNDTNIQNDPDLSTLVNNNFDYEEIYQIVMESNDYSSKQKKILNNAVQNAYRNLDRMLRDGNTASQTFNSLFNNLIFKFSKSRGGSGFIFTLNQDLLIERKFYKFPAESMSIELPVMGSTVFTQLWNKELTDSNRLTCPEDADFSEKQKAYESKLGRNNVPLSYIKLHGSQEWFKDDKDHMMIIGHGKKNRIGSNPLLSWYFEIFERQLNFQCTKLLIIGYGFKDEHINKAISTNATLQLFIIDTQSRKDFTVNLQSKANGAEIQKLIKGYYQVTLAELFPGDVGRNPHSKWDEIDREVLSD